MRSRTEGRGTQGRGMTRRTGGRRVRRRTEGGGVTRCTEGGGVTRRTNGRGMTRRTEGRRMIRAPHTDGRGAIGARSFGCVQNSTRVMRFCTHPSSPARRGRPPSHPASAESPRPGPPTLDAAVHDPLRRP